MTTTARNTVWVTRDEERDGPMCLALADAGLQPVLEPVIQRRVVDPLPPELSEIAAADWLVLTSPYAIRAMPIEFARRARLAVVGEASVRAAGHLGLNVELVSADSTAEGLFRELAFRAADCVVWYPRSDRAALPERSEQLDVRSPVLYETRRRSYRRSVLDEIAVIAVASPSAVRGVGVIDRPYASIGPTTSAALRELGIEPWAQAPEPNFESLARAIVGQLAAS